MQKLPRLAGAESNFDKVDSVPLECSVFVRDGVPDPKLLAVKMFRCSPQGTAPELVATGEINLCLHFGPFAEGSVALETTSIGHARGLVLH